MSTTAWVALVIVALVAFAFGKASRGGETEAEKFQRRAEAAEKAKRLTGASRAALQTLIQQGQLIEAIKLCREETGVGLKEAKDIVEAMRDATAP